MIVITCTYTDLEIGRIYKSRIYDTNCVMHKNMRMRALEKATINDYINYCKEMKCDHLIKNLNDDLYYFEAEILD